MASPASHNGPWTISCARVDGASHHSVTSCSVSSGYTLMIMQVLAQLVLRMDRLVWTEYLTYHSIHDEVITNNKRTAISYPLVLTWQGWKINSGSFANIVINWNTYLFRSLHINFTIKSNISGHSQDYQIQYDLPYNIIAHWTINSSKDLIWSAMTIHILPVIRLTSKSSCAFSQFGDDVDDSLLLVPI